MASEWYYLENNQQQGPVSSAQLKQLAADGRLQPDSLIWKEGLEDWVPASRVKGLFNESQIAAASAPAQQPAQYAPQGAYPQQAYGQAGYPQGGQAYAQDPAVAGYAGFWKRFAAYILDSIITAVIGCVIGFPIGLIIGLTSGGNPNAGGQVDAMANIAGNIIGLIVGWLYWAGMEASSKQATLGKMAVGIVVTDLDGNRISFLRATGRHFAKIISALILLIGFIMAGFTEKKQALHDMMAGCLVVNKP